MKIFKDLRQINENMSDQHKKIRRDRKTLEGDVSRNASAIILHKQKAEWASSIGDYKAAQKHMARHDDVKMRHEWSLRSLLDHIKTHGENLDHLKESLNESLNNTDPPPVLVLRRQGIRLFSGGQRVATYKNDNLNITVAIPYNPNTLGKERISTAVSEETITELSKKILGSYIKKATDKLTKEESEPVYEAVLHHLHNISKTKQPADVIFTGGKTAKVNHQTAASIIRLHSMMKPENKRKIETLINTQDGLKKVAEFAAAHMK